MCNKGKMGLCIVLVAALCLACAGAQAQIGFAEVKMDAVNARYAPGGDVAFRADAGQSVFVFEEEITGGQLWCHVTTFRGKDNVETWIRGDMLRFVGEEFKGVTSVQGGSHYVTGLRADGTVAIMGDDMQHSPCIDSVRGWRNIRQVSSWICEVYGLDAQGAVHAAGRGVGYDGTRAASMHGRIPLLLEADGTANFDGMRDAWAQNPYAYLEDDEGVPIAQAVTVEGRVAGALRTDGSIALSQTLFDDPSALDGQTFKQIDFAFYCLVALRADGTVCVAMRSGSAPLDVSDWQRVTRVAAGTDHVLGLTDDGTVRYAGTSAQHGAQVAAWRDVVDIAGGKGYSIALLSDGSVVMAGKYENYYR